MTIRPVVRHVPPELVHQTGTEPPKSESILLPPAANMDALPYVCFTRISSFATIVNASSQEMRTHSSLPRSDLSPPPGAQFLRFIGYLRRSAPKTCCRC